MSLFNAVLFMPILVLAVGVLDFYYYQIEGAPDVPEESVFNPVTLNPTKDPELVGSQSPVTLPRFLMQLPCIFHQLDHIPTSFMLHNWNLVYINFI